MLGLKKKSTLVAFTLTISESLRLGVRLIPETVPGFKCLELLADEVSKQRSDGPLLYGLLRHAAREQIHIGRGPTNNGYMA